MRLNRLIVNVVGLMLFVQVILGGATTLLSFPVDVHIIWGVITFIVLVAGTVYVARDYGRSSAGFKIALAAIADYVIQGALGFVALGGSDTIVVVHLTNAFVLAVLATYLIAFADRMETSKVATLQSQHGNPKPPTTA
jgi:heme A synthase